MLKYEQIYIEMPRDFVQDMMTKRYISPSSTAPWPTSKTVRK